jgi:hypothetical protein
MIFHYEHTKSLKIPIFENCGLNMQYINTPNIILGIMNPLDPNNTNNQVILILKYYLYKCRCLGDKPTHLKRKEFAAVILWESLN